MRWSEVFVPHKPLTSSLWLHLGDCLLELLLEVQYETIQIYDNTHVDVLSLHIDLLHDYAQNPEEA